MRAAYATMVPVTRVCPLPLTANFKDLVQKFWTPVNRSEMAVREPARSTLVLATVKIMSMFWNIHIPSTVDSIRPTTRLNYDGT